jgi:DNA-binding response OmpR family regulator
MKKILFLTNSDALQTLALKNKNYEFEFVCDEKKLNKILQKKISLEKVDYSLIILDEKVSQASLINFTNLPIISLVAEQQNFNALTYSSKPIHITEFFNEIEILIQNQQRKIFKIDDCIFDFEARFIKKDNHQQETKLTELEAKILIFFLEKKAEEKTKAQLLQEVWSYKNTSQMTDTGVVEVNINKLRKKLKELGIDEQIDFRLDNVD